MKYTQKQPNLDQALLTLVQDGANKYGLFTKQYQELQDEHVDELFDLSLDLLGDNNRHQMQLMPKDKKVILIKQLIVILLID